MNGAKLASVLHRFLCSAGITEPHHRLRFATNIQSCTSANQNHISMQSCKLVITTDSRNAQRAVAAALTDFNRMRWAISAIRCNPTIIAPDASALFDSTCLLNGATPVPQSSHIVLWDGLNSLIELETAVPALVGRSDLRYLFIGQLPDTAASFPAQAQPLFPLGLPDASAMRNRSVVHAPALFELQCHLRAALRPLRNRRISRDRHQALVRGAQIAFCGAVRPTAAILNSFFIGSGLAGLRQHLSGLEGMEWRGRAAAVELQVRQAMAAILASSPATAADAACLYALVNTLHRLGTLSILSGTAAPLLVNEYGYQTHLDPYDAYGYRRNLFADFGSTRGPDLCYPRTVDLALTHKPMAQLRFLQPGQSVLDFLRTSDAGSLWAVCEQHAKDLLVRHQAMFGA